MEILIIYKFVRFFYITIIVLFFPVYKREMTFSIVCLCVFL